MSRPLLALVLLAATPARAATVSGTWKLPAGSAQLAESPEGITGKLVEPAPDCGALAKGAEVLRGTLLEGTFSGEVRVCLEGPECAARESWLSALLMANARGDQLSGTVERGNAACHAKLPGKGGVVVRKLVPGAKPHA